MTDTNTFKVVIAGGRDFNDFDLLTKICDEVLEGYENIEIVSGGAKGADALAKKYAKLHGYKYTEFPADWNTHGKAAGPIRNNQMAEYSHLLIAFWDGKSKGTRNMIDRAYMKLLSWYVFDYEGNDTWQKLWTT